MAKPKKKVSTYLEMEEVINRPYITNKDVMVLAPINHKVAEEITRNIQEKMVENGEPILSTQPRLVPTEYVLKVLNLKASDIRRNAREMRKEKEL